MSPAKNPTVAAIIPTYNRGDRLCATIECLLNQSRTVDEIIVVDQSTNHSPLTKGKLKCFVTSGNIRWIRCRRPNLPRARNIGALYANSRIILYLDDDVTLPHEFVDVHVQTLLERPDVAAVGGRILLPGEDPLEQVKLPVSRRSASRRIDLQTMRYNEPIENPLHLGGGNFCIWADVLWSMGGFSHFFENDALGEDTEFIGRLRRAGWKTYYQPDAWLVHHVDDAGGCRQSSFDSFRKEYSRKRNLYYSMFHGSGLGAGTRLAIRRWIPSKARLPQAKSKSAKSARGSRVTKALGMAAGAVSGVANSILHWRTSGELWTLHRLKGLPAPLCTKDESVAVVIPTCNRLDSVLKAIGSIKEQSNESLEIIVVDQSDEPNQEPIIKQSDPIPVKFLHSETRNASIARNAAAAMTHSDVIIFIDDDAIADSDLIAHHLKAISKPGVVAVGGRVINDRVNGGDPVVVDTDLANYNRIDTPVCYSMEAVTDPLHVITCNLSVRRDAFMQVGGFNERMPGYGEDIDLVSRMRRIGMVLYEPKAVVHHHQAPQGGTRARVLSPFHFGFNRGWAEHYSALRAIGLGQWVAWRLRRLWRLAGRLSGGSGNVVAQSATNPKRKPVIHKVLVMLGSLASVPKAMVDAFDAGYRSGHSVQADRKHHE